MSSIAVISHKSVAHELGLLQEWADARGHSINRFFREDEWNEEVILSADLVIAMGSPNSVATGFVHESADREIALMQKRIAQAESLFGICYGAQALAVALGGEVTRRQSANTGFKKITLHEDSTIAVAGHTDLTGPKSNSLPLSTARTSATVAYLKAALPNIKFIKAAFGDTTPLVSGTTADANAANRRADIGLK